MSDKYVSRASIVKQLKIKAAQARRDTDDEAGIAADAYERAALLVETHNNAADPDFDLPRIAGYVDLPDKRGY